MSSLRIPKLAISQNGLDPSVQKKKAPPKRNPHQLPSSSSTIYHSNSNLRPSTATDHHDRHQHKPATQNRRLLLRTHVDSSSEDEDGIDISDKNGMDIPDTDVDSDPDPIPLKPREAPSKTKVFTSFASGKRFRTEHDLEPKRKRRKTNPQGTTTHSQPKSPKKPKKKRKKKGPNLCVVCEAEIHQDNKAKYCSEPCKEQGKIRNKEKRAEKKKQKELEEHQARQQEEKHHKLYIRKNTASRFGDIFKDTTAGGHLEKLIYRASGGELNDKYSKKVKDLAYNLEKNKELLQSVLNADVTLKQLSLMKTEQLASKDLVLERKQRDERFKKENTLQNKMVFGKVVLDGQYMEHTTDHITPPSSDHTMEDRVTKEDKTPSPTPISTVSTVSTMDHNAVDESPLPPLPAPKKEFNPNEMTEILKSCKHKMKANSVVLENEPLQIQMDSSEDEDEEEEEEEEDVEMSVLEAPEPPPVPQYLQSKREVNKDKRKRNVWNGTLRKSSNDKALNVSLYRIGGKDVKLKSVIPKHLQINGRTKFKDISECLRDLVKVTKSKFTIILSAKCEGKYKREYREIMKECRASKKGFVIDMKQTKAKIKIILLPSFKYKKEECFDVESLQKLWKCSLPHTQDLWALLTVYTKSNCKEKEKEKEEKHKKQKVSQSVKIKAVEPPTDESDAKCGGNDEEKHNGSDARDKGRHSDRERERSRHKERHRRRESNGYDDTYYRDKDRDRDRSRERYRERDRDRKHDRSRERDRDRSKDKNKYHDRERNKEKSRHHRYKDDHNDNHNYRLHHSSSRSK